MKYLAYQAIDDLMEPWRDWAALTHRALGAQEWSTPAAGAFSAACRMLSRASLTHERPSFGIETARDGNSETRVFEDVADETPFATLVRFRKENLRPQPAVLVLAPLSGHFATLLRNTVRTLLADHDVYITDWRNARDVPLAAGPFGFDDYVAHIIRFLEAIGPGAHMIAVCQPCVQGLVAASVMAARDNPAQPRSMTLMAGPVDARVAPTKVNELANSKPIEWFERNLIAKVPERYAGAGRLVYPGFTQLTAFMSMNMGKHVKAHVDLARNVARGEWAAAHVQEAFYDEYFAVLDLAAEFYLETVDIVFQRNLLATGALTFRGERVDPGAIRRTALLTVEGERDDICAVGQTAAAHDLCRNLKPALKKHHLQPGVGHYGVFSGRKWEGQIYPIVRNLILSRAA